jgi:hypothetical protein
VTKAKPKAKPEPYLTDFEAAWRPYPNKKQRLDALAKYQATRKRGVSAETLLQAVRNYSAECYRKGRARDFILMGKTFFGPKRPWEDYLNPEPEQEAPDTAKAKQCHRRGGCRSPWTEIKGNPTCEWCCRYLRKLTPPKERAG